MEEKDWRSWRGRKGAADLFWAQAEQSGMPEDLAGLGRMAAEFARKFPALGKAPDFELQVELGAEYFEGRRRELALGGQDYPGLPEGLPGRPAQARICARAWLMPDASGFYQEISSAAQAWARLLGPGAAKGGRAGCALERLAAPALCGAAPVPLDALRLGMKLRDYCRPLGPFALGRGQWRPGVECRMAGSAAAPWQAAAALDALGVCDPWS